MVGNKVSHANNKTKRRFLPNMQEASFFSSGLKKSITVTCTTNGIRTVEHKGGIDAFLLGTAPTKLPLRLRKIRCYSTTGPKGISRKRSRFLMGAIAR